MSQIADYLLLQILWRLVGVSQRTYFSKCSISLFGESHLCPPSSCYRGGYAFTQISYLPPFLLILILPYPKLGLYYCSKFPMKYRLTGIFLCIKCAKECVLNSTSLGLKFKRIIIVHNYFLPSFPIPLIVLVSWNWLEYILFAFLCSFLKTIIHIITVSTCFSLQLPSSYSHCEHSTLGPHGTMLIT